jgi:retron-type reverse transcriptase
MGLFDQLRRWLFGAEPERSPPLEPEPQDSSESQRTVTNPFTGQRQSVPARRPTRLTRLRYRSSIVRTPSDRESAGREQPYKFAHRNPRTGSWLDLSTDVDPRWLDYYRLPHLKTPQELADWLTVPPGKLAWLAHRFQPGQRPESVQKAHYHYHWTQKRSGGHRLIEAPKALLKQVQQQILHDILNKVPAHAGAHGFVTGRSILSNARPHVGQYLLLKFDLEDFYPSVRFPRIVAIYRSIGFSREVALWLARLTTSVVPHNLVQPTRSPYLLYPYLSRHLPQGAPTSPALANLSAYSLDVRLSGLAQKYHLTYTRYADDLTFSGSRRFGGALREFIPLVERILRDERFRVNKRKRRVLRCFGRQTVTGVVVNSRPNIARHEFDLLKATLANCRRHGPSTQNREQHPDFRSHLRGRIAHVMHLNPHRGQKLLTVFRAIDWSK